MTKDELVTQLEARKAYADVVDQLYDDALTDAIEYLLDYIGDPEVRKAFEKIRGLAE